MDEQQRRIEVLKQTSLNDGHNLFINARTDIFLKTSDPEQHQALLPLAVQRGMAYKEAGADGLFIPGLKDPEMIKALCQAVALPVNIMTDIDVTADDFQALCRAGVARISVGPSPFLAMQDHMRQTAQSYAAFIR